MKWLEPWLRRGIRFSFRFGLPDDRCERCGKKKGDEHRLCAHAFEERI